MIKKLLYFLLITGMFAGCQEEAGLKDLGPAKNFTLYDTDSIRYELADYKGKIVMVHFWADWCPNCRGEFPKIQQAYEKLGSDDFEILAVNSGQSRAHVLAIRENYHSTYPLLIDSDTKTATLYAVAGLPSTFFVDKAGQIRKTNVGWLETDDILQTYELLKKEEKE